MNNPILVVHIISNLGSGGAERVLTNIATHQFPHVRQQVISLTDGGLYGSQLRSAGVEVFCLGMKRRRPSAIAFIRLILIVWRNRPDLVMTWLYHADLMGTLAARAAGIKRIIWNLRGSNIDLSQYSRMTRWTVSLLSRLSQMPIAIAANSVVGEQVHKKFGYKNSVWLYLPNGFDTAIWKPSTVYRDETRNRLGIEDKFVFGLIGRNDPQKDHENLFRAAEKMSAAKTHKIRFILLGRGTDQLAIPDALRPLFITLGERTDVQKVICGLDALILCSAYGEGFPNAIGEGMATGLPCIATDTGDCSRIIGDNGIIVPPKNSDALKTAIEEVLEWPQEKIDNIAQNARARIETTFSQEACAARYNEVFMWGAARNSKEPCDSS